MTKTLRWVLGLAAVAAAVLAAAYFLDLKVPVPGKEETESAAVPEHAEEEAGGAAIKMDAAERKAQGVETALVERRRMADEIIVPGEVATDIYRSSEITPRISAQVIARYAKLGDRVTAGQRLVALSSVEMAKAQGALIVANREWERVQELGREVVSERRYVEAQVAAEQARAKVLSYGMTRSQVDSLLEGDRASEADGTFTLLSPQNGLVISDDFVLGEIVDPGRVLFRIADESRLWVEAQVSPAQGVNIGVGTPARILAENGVEIEGRVVQLHHTLDETTRTRAIRVEVENAGDRIHPGQFVNVAIEVGDATESLVVPQRGVVLMNNDRTVFRIEGDELRPVAVKIGASRGEWIEIESGLSEGDEIVVSEVFLFKSLMLKSAIGSGHGH